MDGDESESLRKFMEDVKSTAKNGIILSGVLSWVDIQTHTTAVGVRQEQMASLFTLEEIEEAMEDLWSACGGDSTVIGAIARRNNVPNKAKNMIDDIFKAFKKLEEANKKPAILATSIQMRTIRPYNLGDVAQVQATDVMERVKLLEECISNQNKTIMELVSKMADFSMAQTTRPTQPEPPVQPVERQLGAAGGTGHVGPMAGGAAAFPRVGQLIQQAYGGRDGRTSRTPKRRRPLSSGDVENVDEHAGSDPVADTRDTWATVAGNNTGGRKGQPLRDNSKSGHWRQKSMLVNGTSYENNDDKSFAADISLVAGGVSKNATVDKLTDYLKNKGLDIVSCELLTNNVEQCRTLSFKVTIKAEDFERAKNPAIWPYRVVVRKFVHFRRKVADEFASASASVQQQMRGVRQLDQGAGRGPAQHHQEQQQQQSATPVFNRFNVSGFRDGESH